MTTKHAFRNLIDFCKDVFNYFIDIDTSSKAAALAYVTLVSMVPLMVLSFGIILAFPSLSTYFKSIHDFLFSHLIPSSAMNIQHHIEIFIKNANQLSATSLIFFFITAVFLIFSMETIFNSIWKVKRRRKGIYTFIMYWATITLLPPVGGIIFTLSSTLYSVHYLSHIMKFITIFIPFLLTWSAYVFLYMALPNYKVLFRHAAVGATVATIAFEIMKSGFKLYLSLFPSFEIVYGVLSVIPIFLTWLYLAWMVTIIGAIIAYKLGHLGASAQARYDGGYR